MLGVWGVADGYVSRLRYVMRRQKLSPDLKIYSTRQKNPRRRAKSTPLQIVSIRLTEFAILFRSRYGQQQLPDDDSGRDDIQPVMHHLGALDRPQRAITNWLKAWAPWLTLAEHEQFMIEGVASRRSWTADQLAWRYKITNEERKMLGLTTIGAIDMPKAARKKRRLQRERMRKMNKRRENGAKPRKEFEANSIERTKPWLDEGISRATWYRRNKRETETGPVTA